MAIVFEATAVATFDNLGGGNFQRVFDLSNGPGQDSIWLGNVWNTDTIEFQVEQDGVRYGVQVANAIDEGVETEWYVTVDDTGTLTISKDGVQIASQNLGVNAVPNDVPRTASLIGDSPHAADDPLIGSVTSLNLETTLSNGFDMTFTDTVNVVDTFNGSDQAETLDASAQTTGITLYGDGGDDTIYGGSGGDSLYGGDGDDLFFSSDGGDTYNGGSGLDIIDYSASDAAINVHLSWRAFSGGHAEGDTADGVDGLIGSAFDDTLIGFDSEGPDYTNILYGGAGGDIIDGWGGDDYLYGDADDDTIDGGSGDDEITGGTGDDSITGGSGNDTFFYIPGDGHDTITDFNSGNSGTLSDGDATNNDSIDLSDYYDRIAELYADQADDGILNQSNDGVDGADYSDNTSFGAGSLTFTGATSNNSTFTTENTGVVCFVGGTMIRTTRGEVPVEHLEVGGLVQTMDRAAQPLRWVGKRHIDSAELAQNPNLRQVRISKAAVGLTGLTQDLVVSPQHRILLASHIARRMFGATQVLVPAKKLLCLPGIEVAEEVEAVTYFHILFNHHEIVFANGVPAESLYLGQQALNSLGPEGRSEIETVFPETMSARFTANQCRPFAENKRATRMAQRLAKNGHPLVAKDTFLLALSQS